MRLRVVTARGATRGRRRLVRGSTVGAGRARKFRSAVPGTAALPPRGQPRDYVRPLGIVTSFSLDGIQIFIIYCRRNRTSLANRSCVRGLPAKWVYDELLARLGTVVADVGVNRTAYCAFSTRPSTQRGRHTRGGATFPMMNRLRALFDPSMT